MNPSIVLFPGLRLAGVRAQMSLDANSTATLWQRFGALYREYDLSFAMERYSVAMYPPGFFEPVDLSRQFEKWAAAPFVGNSLPDASLEWVEIPAGLYAVFSYQGPAAEAGPFFSRIYSEWLPLSGFGLDSRPHFEMLPPEYRPDDPNARETVYIPLRRG